MHAARLGQARPWPRAAALDAHQTLEGGGSHDPRQTIQSCLWCKGRRRRLTTCGLQSGATRHRVRGYGEGKRISGRLSGLLNRPLHQVLLSAAVGIAGFAASLLALVTAFGVLGVGISFAIGVSLVSVVWYCAQLLRVLDVRSAMRVRVEEIQRGFADLGTRYTALEQERDQYEYAVSVIAYERWQLVHHKSAEIIHEIGETPDGDRVTERYVTRTGDQRTPVLWYDVRVTVSGAGVPLLSSFRDLRNSVLAEQIATGQTYLLSQHAAGHWPDGGVRGMFIFEPAIGMEPREWMWTYRWPVFNPLRAYRRDTVGFEVMGRVKYEVLEIKVIFPQSALRPRMQPMGPNERYAGGDIAVDDRNRQIIAVRLIDPDPADYSWRLSVEGFSSSAQAEASR